MNEQDKTKLAYMDFFELGRVLKERVQRGELSLDDVSRIWKWWGRNNKKKGVMEELFNEEEGYEVE